MSSVRGSKWASQLQWANLSERKLSWKYYNGHVAVKVWKMTVVNDQGKKIWPPFFWGGGGVAWGTRFITGCGGAARALVPWPCLRHVTRNHTPCNGIIHIETLFYLIHWQSQNYLGRDQQSNALYRPRKDKLFNAKVDQSIPWLRQKMINSIPRLRQKSRKTHPGWRHVSHLAKCFDLLKIPRIYESDLMVTATLQWAIEICSVK